MCRLTRLLLTWRNQYQQGKLIPITGKETAWQVLSDYLCMHVNACLSCASLSLDDSMYDSHGVLNNQQEALVADG